MSKDTVGNMSEWSGMLSDLFRQIKDGSIGLAQLQAFLEHRDPFGLGDIQSQLASWASFYKKHFNLELDVAIIKVPPQNPGFDLLIVVAKGLTLNKVYDECAKQFPCWRYENDLDKAIQTNDRDPKNGSYAVWVRNRVEADVENNNLSANKLKQHGTSGITLLERMLYELKSFTEIGKHLDIENVTLCTGSRCSGGGVPSAGWSSDGFRVGWCLPGYSYDSLRSRSVVS